MAPFTPLSHEYHLFLPVLFPLCLIAFLPISSLKVMARLHEVTAELPILIGLLIATLFSLIAITACRH